MHALYCLDQRPNLLCIKCLNELHYVLLSSSATISVVYRIVGLLLWHTTKHIESVQCNKPEVKTTGG